MFQCFNFLYFDKNFNLDIKIDIKNIFSESYIFSIFFFVKNFIAYNILIAYMK